MNKRGFTLIELVATIALLGIIAVISFVSINAVVNKNKENNCEILVSSIITATKDYVSDNRYNIDELTLDNFNASILVNNNYLDGQIKNPYTKEDITPDSIKILVELNEDLTYKTSSIIEPTILQDCNIKRVNKMKDGVYACASGMYLAKGNINCSVCPAGYSCPGGDYEYSDTIDQGITICEKGTYSSIKSNECTPCVKGSYNDEEGSTSCVACNPKNLVGDNGTTTGSGKFTCNVSCNKEHVKEWETAEWKSNNTVTNSCKIKSCEDNYKIENGSCIPAVVNCSAGKYLPKASFTCKDCPAGYSCPGGDLPYSETADSGKTKCLAGTFAEAKSSSCTNCAQGSYSGEGASGCTVCANGKTNTAGASNCPTNCSNASGVSTWVTPSWTNNSVANSCKVSTCRDGYYKDGNKCKAYTCYEPSNGSSCYRSRSIYSSTEYSGLQPANHVRGYRYNSEWTYITGETSAGYKTYGSANCYMLNRQLTETTCP